MVNCGPPATSPIAKTRRLVVRSRASTVIPCAVAAIPAAGRSSAPSRPPPGSDQEMRSLDPSPPASRTQCCRRRARRRRSRRGRGAQSLHRPVPARLATSSGSSAAIVARDRDGDLRAEPAMGLRHSIPIGPPPMTIRCPAARGWQKSSRSSDRERRRARDRRDRRIRAGGDDKAARPDLDLAGSDRAGAREPRFAAQDRDPEPLERLTESSARSPRSRARHYPRRPRNRRRAEIGNAERRAAPRHIRKPRRGKQRFRRDAAEVEAIAAHQPALDQDDIGTHLSRAGRDRKPAEPPPMTQRSGASGPVMPALCRASACSRPGAAPRGRARRSGRTGSA